MDLDGFDAGDTSTETPFGRQGEGDNDELYWNDPLLTRLNDGIQALFGKLIDTDKWKKYIWTFLEEILTLFDFQKWDSAEWIFHSLAAVLLVTIVSKHVASGFRRLKRLWRGNQKNGDHQSQRDDIVIVPERRFDIENPPDFLERDGDDLDDCPADRVRNSILRVEARCHQMTNSLSNVHESTEEAIQTMLLTNKEIVTQLLPQLASALTSLQLQMPILQNQDLTQNQIHDSTQSDLSTDQWDSKNQMVKNKTQNLIEPENLDEIINLEVSSEEEESEEEDEEEENDDDDDDDDDDISLSDSSDEEESDKEDSFNQFLIRPPKSLKPKNSLTSTALKGKDRLNSLFHSMPTVSTSKQESLPYFESNHSISLKTSRSKDSFTETFTPLSASTVEFVTSGDSDNVTIVEFSEAAAGDSDIVTVIKEGRVERIYSKHDAVSEAMRSDVKDGLKEIKENSDKKQKKVTFLPEETGPPGLSTKEEMESMPCQDFCNFTQSYSPSRRPKLRRGMSQPKLPLSPAVSLPPTPMISSSSSSSNPSTYFTSQGNLSFIDEYTLPTLSQKDEIEIAATSECAEINESLPNYEFLASNESAETNESLPNNEFLPSNGSAEINESLPNNENLASNESAETNEFLPNNEFLASNESAETNESLPNDEFLASNESAETTESFPNNDLSASNESLPNNELSACTEPAETYKSFPNNKSIESNIQTTTNETESNDKSTKPKSKNGKSVSFSGVIENIYNKDRKKIGVPILPKLPNLPFTEALGGWKREEKGEKEKEGKEEKEKQEEEKSEKLCQGKVETYHEDTANINVKECGSNREEKKSRNFHVKEDWMPMMLSKPRPSEQAVKLTNDSKKENLTSPKAETDMEKHVTLFECSKRTMETDQSVKISLVEEVKMTESLNEHNKVYKECNKPLEVLESPIGEDKDDIVCLEQFELCPYPDKNAGVIGQFDETLNIDVSQKEEMSDGKIHASANENYELNRGCDKPLEMHVPKNGIDEICGECDGPLECTIQNATADQYKGFDLHGKKEHDNIVVKNSYCVVGPLSVTSDEPIDFTELDYEKAINSSKSLDSAFSGEPHFHDVELKLAAEVAAGLSFDEFCTDDYKEMYQLIEAQPISELEDLVLSPKNQITHTTAAAYATVPETTSATPTLRTETTVPPAVVATETTAVSAAAATAVYAETVAAETETTVMFAAAETDTTEASAVVAAPETLIAAAVTAAVTTVANEAAAAVVSQDTIATEAPKLANKLSGIPKAERIGRKKRSRRE